MPACLLRPRQVIRMFFMSGVRLSMLGVVLGLLLSVVALHMLASHFADVGPGEHAAGRRGSSIETSTRQPPS